MAGLFNEPERHMKLIQETTQALSRQPNHTTRSSANFLIRVFSKQIDGVWYALGLNEQNQAVACAFTNRSRDLATKSVAQSMRFVGVVVGEGSNGADDWFEILHGLHLGKPSGPPNSCDLSHVSEFRRRVYGILNMVPRGYVTTYGAIAKRIGSKRISRGVGSAVAANPLPLIIPCHRVVPASLSVGNYGTPGGKPSQGAPIKRTLLQCEGVKFDGDKISKQSVWYPK